MTTPTVSRSKPSSNDPCPCGSGRILGECCGAIISGRRAAATAEELMRSRFTAHVLQDDRYLHFSYLTSSRQPFHEVEDPAEVTWTRLEIHSHEPGASPDIAFVDFTAFFQDESGVDQALQEKSEFRKIDGKWFYTRSVRQGPPPVRSSAPKVGRNDPCPCGSGKKYKHCCLAKA